MPQDKLIVWRARLSRLVRYSVLASVGLGATIAFLGVDQFTGYKTITRAVWWLIGGLVLVCTLAALTLTFFAVREMGAAGVVWVLQSAEDVDA